LAKISPKVFDFLKVFLLGGKRPAPNTRHEVSDGIWRSPRLSGQRGEFGQA